MLPLAEKRRRGGLITEKRRRRTGNRSGQDRAGFDLDRTLILALSLGVDDLTRAHAKGRFLGDLSRFTPLHLQSGSSGERHGPDDHIFRVRFDVLKREHDTFKNMIR